MTPLPPASFSELSPDMVLDALQSLNLHGDGRLLALNSYENRVYQVGMEDTAPVIVKFYRPGRWTDAAIREEHQFVDALYAQEIPVVPAICIANDTLHMHQGYRFAVFPRQGGRAPELDRDDTLKQMGRLMGRIHAVSADSAYQHRPALDVLSFGDEPRAWLLDHHFIPPDLLDSWQSVTTQALESVRYCYERAGDLRYLRLHGDCHGGNVLWTDDGPHFVDFDDSRSGPAVQDLWMLLSGERQERSTQLAILLAGYEDFFEFNPRELHLIEALRTLRLLHYSAWLARRWDDPAFPAAFPWFNTVRYWQDRILELREQIALMDEPPLWPL
jgi:Ser/Thr protein kinase RdoA (MazF antagonist)